MPFHRFKDPAYDSAPGGAPPWTIGGTTYDRINVTDEGVGLAGSAVVDGVTVGPPNAGTYMVAFGEDGRSAAVNRGLRALTDNTDHLDDLVHRDLAVPAKYERPSGAASSSFTITGEVYVGPGGGGTDTQRNRSGLIQLVNQSTGEPLHYLTGGSYQPVKVTAIVDTPTVEAGGFVTDPLITVSPDIPVSTPVTVVYYTRDAVATQLVEVGTELTRAYGNWEADLWSFVRNILQTNQTFLGDNSYTGTSLFTEAIVADLLSNATPLFSSTKGPSDDLTNPGSNWKLLFEFSTKQASERLVRFYVGDDGDGEGQFCITVGAHYLPATNEWERDTANRPPVRMNLRCNTGEAALHLEYKQNPVAPWADNDWDKEPVSDLLGAMIISGEYRYETQRTRVVLMSMVEGVAFRDGGAEDFKLGGSGQSWFSAGGAGSASVYFPLKIPDGERLTKVRAVVDDRSGNPVIMQLHEQVPDFGTPAGAGTTILGSDTSNGTGLDVLELDEITDYATFEFENATKIWWLKLFVNTPSALALVAAVELTFLDFGPKNY